MGKVMPGTITESAIDGGGDGGGAAAAGRGPTQGRGRDQDQDQDQGRIPLVVQVGRLPIRLMGQGVEAGNTIFTNANASKRCCAYACSGPGIIILNTEKKLLFFFASNTFFILFCTTISGLRKTDVAGTPTPWSLKPGPA